MEKSINCTAIKAFIAYVSISHPLNIDFNVCIVRQCSYPILTASNGFDVRVKWIIALYIKAIFKSLHAPELQTTIFFYCCVLFNECDSKLFILFERLVNWTHCQLWVETFYFFIFNNNLFSFQRKWITSLCLQKNEIRESLMMMLMMIKASVR